MPIMNMEKRFKNLIDGSLICFISVSSNLVYGIKKHNSNARNSNMGIQYASLWGVLKSCKYIVGIANTEARKNIPNKKPDGVFHVFLFLLFA